jgi:hemerythrin-like domain-containing protein
MIQIRTGQAAGETATLDSPLDHLMACHRRIEDRLATLERSVAALSERREEALSAIHAAFRFMDSNGVIHTQDEEQSIFPRLASSALIQELEADHREAGRIDAELRAAVARVESGDDAAIDDCKTFVSALCKIYRGHIEREDTQFVPAARAQLSPAALAEVSREMKSRRGLA